MSVLEDIASDRQKFVDAIEANKGDINLDIFEDFYPDQAHFIYELLQNAEDAGATEVCFELRPHLCVFEHNGVRHFGEDDIRSITGIHSSTKKTEPDKIGKYGVGFKSVFVYTETPIIYSKNFSFRIVKRVIPKSVQPKPSLGERTRFELPFDNPRKNVKQAFDEVKAGLEQLSETTLLFLKNLRYISWKIDNLEGAVLRGDHSDCHVEVLKQLDGKDVFSSHWLRFQTSVDNLHQFTAPAPGMERQKVAVAFELAFVGGQKSFDKAVPIAKQLKIVSAPIGKVSVFFPADKETSGLRFHLHAPFVPELSRASIKNSPENTPLFEQIARLSARSLHSIKEMGLLTSDFLDVLPNADDYLPDRYQVIRSAIIREMTVQSLVPTQAQGFAPAQRLVQARASIKGLLSDADLATLFTSHDGLTWAVGAIRNSRQDRFLSSLEITKCDVEILTDFLCAKDFNDLVRQSDGEYLPKATIWLASKADDWHQLLYATLARSRDDFDGFDRLKDAQIVKLANGAYAVGCDAYFSTGAYDSDDPLPKVSYEVLTVGARKNQQTDARNFLEEIGVRVPGEAEEIKFLLQTRYAQESVRPEDKTHIADLKRFIVYLDKNPSDAEIFTGTWLFRVDSEAYDWATPSSIYLDCPNKSTGLGAYFRALPFEDDQKWLLSKRYSSCGIDIGVLTDFAKLVGCTAEFEDLIESVDCRHNSNYHLLQQAPGGPRRSSTLLGEDWVFNDSLLKLLVEKNEEISKLAWLAMFQLDERYLQARFRWSRKHDFAYTESQLIDKLKNVPWIPTENGFWVTPRQVIRNELREGFKIYPGSKWLDAVEFEADHRVKSAEGRARLVKLAEVGFKSEQELQRAHEFLKLPEDRQKGFLDSVRYVDQFALNEFPEGSVRNADIRNQRVREEAEQTPKKRYEGRLRSIAVDVDSTKEGAKAYLRTEYTSDRVMYCQVCKTELPFKRRNGEYYFEAVEISDAVGKRLRQTFLALCPNHAAMFKHANDQEKEMLDLVATSSGREIEVVLGGTPTTIQFTATHLADMKACLAAGETD